MERINKYIVPLLILILIVSSVVIFRSLLMTYIIEPIALMLWFFWRIVSSVDQNIYWIALVVICAILFILLIPPENDKSPVSAYNYTSESLNRVEYWQSVLEDAALGVNESDYLHDNLMELLTAVISQMEESDLTESEQIIAKAKESLSPAAYSKLFTPIGKFGRVSKSHQLNIRYLVPRWLRKRAKMYKHQDITMTDEILRWMETELEITYEK